MSLDSVPLHVLRALPEVTAAQLGSPSAASAAVTNSGRGGTRDLVIIFILFLVVVSDFFANNMLSRFGTKTMEGRAPSAWGIVLQGVCLSLSYALLVYLDEQQII